MSGAHLPCIVRAITDLAHVRMHGPNYHHLYAGSYSNTDLRWLGTPDPGTAQAKRCVRLLTNDGNANAVRNARTLQALLGQ
jgi:Protein of unknown function DUF72